MPPSDDFLSGDKSVAGVAADQIYPGVDAPVVLLEEWWIRIGRIVDKDPVIGPLARGEKPAAWESLEPRDLSGLNLVKVPKNDDTNYFKCVQHNLIFGYQGS